MSDQLSFIIATGRDIESHISDLGKLRISVFYDFPYLYEGDLAFEKQYLQIYANHSQGFLFAVYDQNEMVGATTGIPLLFETGDIQAPFVGNGIAIESVFYFGESILLPTYRGKGLGHRFFDEREKFALNIPTISTTAFCSVKRPDNHPFRPADYRSNADFWKKRGYSEQESMICQMAWLDRGETTETTKELIFWTKKWR